MFNLDILSANETEKIELVWNSAGQNVPKCADNYDLGDWVSENEGGKIEMFGSSVTEVHLPAL